MVIQEAKSTLTCQNRLANLKARLMIPENLKKFMSERYEGSLRTDGSSNAAPKDRLLARYFNRRSISWRILVSNPKPWLALRSMKFNRLVMVLSREKRID
jgi:hypothetical protein